MRPPCRMRRSQATLDSCVTPNPTFLERLADFGVPRPFASPIQFAYVADVNKEMHRISTEIERTRRSYPRTLAQVSGVVDAICEKAGMYIGDTADGSGQHRMVQSLVDHAIDEVVSGYCDDIQVFIHSDDGVTVRDNGRGIPVDRHPDTGIPVAEMIMTMPPASPGFEGDSCPAFGEPLGVGRSVVNALSSEFWLTVRRGGHVFQQVYRNGVPEAPLAMTCETDFTGTECYFEPSVEVFGNTAFSFDILARLLREIASRHFGVEIRLADERAGKDERFGDRVCGLLTPGEEPIFGRPVVYVEDARVRAW